MISDSARAEQLLAEGLIKVERAARTYLETPRAVSPIENAKARERLRAELADLEKLRESHSDSSV